MQLVIWMFLGAPLVSAQAHHTEQPTYDDDGVLVASANPQLGDSPAGGLSFGPRGLYLASLTADGGAFAGAELAFGGWIHLDGPLSLVVRARAASHATVRSPGMELDDTSCGGGGALGSYFTLCFGDLDMLTLGLGGELGLRIEHRVPAAADAAFTFGGELGASGTGYLDSFEHVDEQGGVGAMLALSADLVVGNRWGLGLELGGRLEAGIGGADRAAVHGGLRFSFRP